MHPALHRTARTGKTFHRVQGFTSLAVHPRSGFCGWSPCWAKATPPAGMWASAIAIVCTCELPHLMLSPAPHAFNSGKRRECIHRLASAAQCCFDHRRSGFRVAPRPYKCLGDSAPKCRILPCSTREFCSADRILLWHPCCRACRKIAPVRLSMSQRGDCVAGSASHSSC